MCIRDRSAALKSDVGVIFLLFGDVLNIGEMVGRAHAAGKAVFVHLDLVDGLAAREVSVDFIARNTAADGVLSTCLLYTSAMRVIYNPAIIHPWSHFSQRSTVATISFFEQALGAPNPLSATDQIWQWKVVANTVGLVAFFLFIVSLTLVLVRKPFFSAVRKTV